MDVSEGCCTDLLRVPALVRIVPDATELADNQGKLPGESSYYPAGSSGLPLLCSRL